MKSFQEISAQHFNLTPEEMADSLTPKDVPEWDSMNYLLFITKLEEVYGVSFTMDEVLTASSLGELRQFLIAKGAPV